jgi:hypothetical protein
MNVVRCTSRQAAVGLARIMALGAFGGGGIGEASSPGQPSAAQKNTVQKNAAHAPPAKESNPAGEIPDSQVYVPYTAAHGFSRGDVTAVQRKAGPAIRITYRANSVPNPVTGTTVAHAAPELRWPSPAPPCCCPPTTVDSGL